MQRWQNVSSITEAVAREPQQGQPQLKSFQYFSGQNSFVSQEVINELQNEVSSLLEFKNALLETFPHLQGRLGGSTSSLSQPRSASAAVVSSKPRSNPDQLDPSASSNNHASSNATTRVHRTDNVSDDNTSSWSGGSTSTLSRPLMQASGKKIRKSPEGSSTGSNVVDSGFSTDTVVSSSRMPLDVRWDTWEDGPPMPAIGNAANSHDEDELLNLLDVIHRKTVRLRRDLDTRHALDMMTLVEHDAGSRAVAQKSSVPQAHSASALDAISEVPVRDDEFLQAHREALLRQRDRDFLVRRVHELETENADCNVKINRLMNELAKQKDREGDEGEDPNQAGDGSQIGDEAGIVHSVHIRTGQSPDKKDEQNHQVNIEIKQKQQQRLSSTPGVSVVNLRPSSTSDHSSQTSSPAAGSKKYRGRLPSTGINRVMSTHRAMKSRSVENLYDGYHPHHNPLHQAVLGLKNANSEMNMQAMNSSSGNTSRKPARQQLIHGAKSEMNVSRLGVTEKVRLDGFEGIASMPAELARGLKGQVKPNREKISQILKMDSVIDLQRYLLTSVMENEIYKTQLERVSEGWVQKIGNFERLNGSLHSEMVQLQRENDELKAKVNKKVVELESTKARLKVLERNSDSSSSANAATAVPKPPRLHVESGTLARPALTSSSKAESASGKQVDENNYVRYNANSGANNQTNKGENRVHFDLQNMNKSNGIHPSQKQQPSQQQPIRRTNTNLTDGSRGNQQQLARPNQLPTDARQRLEEMANSSKNAVRKYSNASQTINRTTSNGIPKRNEITDPVQELIASKFQYPRTVTNNNNNNNNNSTTSVSGAKIVRRDLSQPSRPSQLPLSTQTRDVSHRAPSVGGTPTTPSQLSNLSPTSYSSSTLVSVSGDPHLDASKKDVVLEKDLKTMGRETIAGLIAGILQKYSHKKEDEPEKEVVTKLQEDEQTTTHHHENQSMSLQPNSSSIKRSWEADNNLEEFTHKLTQREPVSKSPEQSQQEVLFAPRDTCPDSLLHEKMENIDLESIEYADDSLKQSKPSPPDSLSFDEDTFADKSSNEYFDSIGSSNTNTSKKLIMPYPKTFSSSSSEVEEDDDEEEEEDGSNPYSSSGSLRFQKNQLRMQQKEAAQHPLNTASHNNRRLPSVPIIPYNISRTVSSPDFKRLIQGSPDHHPRMSTTGHFSPGLSGRRLHDVSMDKIMEHAGETSSVSSPSGANPANSQSLVRMATERMKRKILGWN